MALSLAVHPALQARAPRLLGALLLLIVSYPFLSVYPIGRLIDFALYTAVPS